MAEYCGGGGVMKCGSEITLNNSLPCSMDTVHILLITDLCMCKSSLMSPVYGSQ